MTRGTLELPALESVGSWSLLTTEVVPVHQAASLALLGVYHMEWDPSPLGFGAFLSDRSFGLLWDTLD